jgi:uncharacterized protein (TIGR00369 family)
VPERQPPSKEQLERYATAFNASKSLKYFGLTLTFPDADTVQVEMAQVQPEHRGGLGTDAVNGGVLAAMFDLTIGCTPALIDPTKRTATVQLSMSLERPVRGDRVRAVGKIDRSGESLLFATAVIYDQAGVACARCQGVVRLSKIPWVSKDSPAVN